MKPFADYERWMEEDKILEEQLDHLKKYADILKKCGALPKGVSLEQIMKAMMQRVEPITPQILEEMYLRVALCMRINNAYKLEPKTICYSVLYSKWAGKGKGKDYGQAAKDLERDIGKMRANTNKYQGAATTAIHQALQDISNGVEKKMDKRGLSLSKRGFPEEVGGLSKYQQKALWVYRQLVDIQTQLQQNKCSKRTALTKDDKLLQILRLQKKEDTSWTPYANIKWSPFYDRVQDEFSACLKTLQKNPYDVPEASYLLALLTRLQVAVLDEVLVQLSDGLDYLCKNFWFSNADVKNSIRVKMKKRLVVVNDRKHALSFFCAAIANGTYLNSFSLLLVDFFTPELDELCPIDQMIGERTKRGEFWWK